MIQTSHLLPGPGAGVGGNCLREETPEKSLSTTQTLQRKEVLFLLAPITLPVSRSRFRAPSSICYQQPTGRAHPDSFLVLLAGNLQFPAS